MTAGRSTGIGRSKEDLTIMDRSIIRVRTTLVGLAAMAAIVVGACSSAATPAPAASSAVAPSAATSTAPSAAAPSSAATAVLSAATGSVGPYLTGANGMTLYTYKPDASNPGKSVCTGGCAATWPPFVVPAGQSPTAGAGVTGSIATIVRDDSSTQVTYKGLPVYYFTGDSAAGDTKGQGIGGIWFVVAP